MIKVWFKFVQSRFSKATQLKCYKVLYVLSLLWIYPIYSFNKTIVLQDHVETNTRTY
jgi:hypothetical protein